METATANPVLVLDDIDCRAEFMKCPENERLDTSKINTFIV